MNGDDRDWKQTLPKDLDRDDYHGRLHIRALLSGRAQASLYRILIQISQSFLLVMTHSALVNCLSVDTYVGSLYNFISGANGTRAIPFFQHLCEILVAARVETDISIPLDILDSTLISLSTALSELLRRESRARYNEQLPDLINSLRNAAQLITEEGSLVTRGILIQRATDLQSVVARACGLLCAEEDAEPNKQGTSVFRSTYTPTMLMPGGRHDNDKADISKIKIFPTQDEIMSDVGEFLPPTDPDQPHFLTSKAERYIDTHFRLLRHDTFGKLKEALACLMQTLVNDPGQLGNPKVEFGDKRAYTYTNATVRYLTLSRRAVLQANISIPQPYNIRRESRVDRKKWWEESRRLEEGVLVSFICIKESTVQHMFFTVAERHTDVNKSDSLTYDKNMATISVKLTTQDQPAVEALLDLSRNKIRGILLEFPHVLPATFVHVLENLQNMQLLSRLPFRELILPDRVDGPAGVKLDVPPPLYARNPNFAFSLRPILANDAAGPMRLYPSLDNYAALAAEMEPKTDLDHAQCIALIEALTREFALIQGPPGTGKSFLGVKIMKVLVDAKKKYRLGPIVVV